jgi:Uma2 family endonuclease
MTALRKQRMTVNEFLPWAKQQAERWELFDGIPTAMSPERVIHGDTKYRAARVFDAEIAQARVPCRFVLDSAAVRVDTRNSYQPDVLVYCGAPLPDDALEVPDPVIVVEILSSGNAATDLRDKLQGYFHVASVQHYLIIDPDKRLVIYHARGRDDAVTTRIVTTGQILLDPPGLSVATGDFFGPASG